jgi:hypothetical protein
MEFIKHLIKKYCWKLVFYNKLFGKTARASKAFVASSDPSTSLSSGKLDVFTVAGEDGIILNIFARIGSSGKTFIDIGSNDCINSNCANLAFHHHWNGIFIDGNKNILDRGKYIYKKYFGKAVNRFQFVHSIVTVKNINEILGARLADSEVDLLSIDLDGNDYFIWQAIAVVNPRLVITEVQVEKGNADFIPEYNNEFELYEDDMPKGVSPLSMQKLAEIKGYELVAVNKGCYNLFFVRKDCMQHLKALTIEEVLQSC